MTNDLKNFLEVKLKEVEDNTNLLRGLPNDDEALDLIMKTYTEVSNFVLDLVENEIDNKRALDSEIFAASGNNDEESRDRIKVLEDISTIINKLRV